MLCKCSGKYIDIYFILKITFSKPMAKMGHGKFQVDHRNFIFIVGHQAMGPQLIEWSIELLLTTGP